MYFLGVLLINLVISRLVSARIEHRELQRIYFGYGYLLRTGLSYTRSSSIYKISWELSYRIGWYVLGSNPGHVIGYTN